MLRREFLGALAVAGCASTVRPPPARDRRIQAVAFDLLALFDPGTVDRVAARLVPGAADLVRGSSTSAWMRRGRIWVIFANGSHGYKERVMKLLAMSGSLRATSSTAAIVRAIAGIEGIELEHANIGDLPHFSPDLDDAPPASVTALRDAIAAADAVVIVTQEYAHGMPGALKNALDWLVSSPAPIDKRVLLVSASPGGAAHAHAQFSEVLRTMSMRLVDGGAHVFSRAKLDSRGEVTDPTMLDALRDGVVRLVARERE